MDYISVREFAKKWNVPERTVRNYFKEQKDMRLKGVVSCQKI